MKAEDSRTVDTDEEAPRRNLGRASCGAETDATARLRTKAESSGLMEAVAGRGNLMLAYQREASQIVFFNAVLVACLQLMLAVINCTNI